MAQPAAVLRQRVFHNLLLEAELLWLVRELEAGGFQVVVLKGVPLARRIYSDLSQRSIRDNDLLVRPERWDAAAEALLRLGYAASARETRRRAQVRTSALQFTRREGHHQFHVDLHWTAFPRTMFVPLTEQWAHVVRQPCGPGQQLSVLDDALTIVHLASHLAKDGFLKAQTLNDLSHAWRRLGPPRVDADEVFRLARLGRLEAALGYGLRLAGATGLLELAGGPALAPSPLLDRVLPPAVAAAQLRRGAEPRGLVRYRLALARYLAGDLRAGLRQAALDLVPPVESVDPQGRLGPLGLGRAYSRRVVAPAWDALLGARRR